MSFDAFFDSVNSLKEMTQRLDSLIRQVGDGCIVIYTHPCRLFTARWPDNFRWGRNTPKELWESVPMRDESEISSIKADFQRFVAQVSSRTDLRTITYADLYRQYREEQLWLDRATLGELASRSVETVDHQVVNSRSFSPAQILAVMSEALSIFDDHGALPESLPVRHPLGPLLDPPPGPQFRATTERVVDAAKSCFSEILNHHSLPHSIQLGRRKTGPGACLRTFSKLVGFLLQGQSLPKEIEVAREQGPRILLEKSFTELRFKDAWSIFPPSFEGAKVVRMARLQAWTAKPALRRTD